MSSCEMRNPCKTYPDNPCYGCKRCTVIGHCMIFSPMEHNISLCPCLECLVKPMCTDVCDKLKEYIDAEMLKRGMPL